jgi:hypothetical protein
MLRSDCLMGYLAMSHWKRVMYCDNSAGKDEIVSSRELPQISGQLTVIRQQVLNQLVPLILENVAKISGDLARDRLNVGIQLAQVIRQSDKLVKRSDLQVWNVELEVLAQVVLLAGDVVHRLPCLLTCLITGRRYQPIFAHGVVGLVDAGSFLKLDENFSIFVCGHVMTDERRR